MLREVERRIADSKILKLIENFLKSGLMNKGKFAPTEEGTPQGGIASPLLANIYLHKFDQWFDKGWAIPEWRTKEYSVWYRKTRKGKSQAAARMYRYADDWIILVRGTKQQAEQIKQQCKSFLLDELGLELSEEKTRLTHLKEGFDFLGYHIFRNYKLASRRKIGVFIRPTSKGLQRVKLKIKQMTKRNSLNDDYLFKLKAINAVVRGWANYYRAVNPAKTFKKLDYYVWVRLSKWLQKKHRTSPKQVRQRYMHRREGPRGGETDFATFDEGTNKWVWQYRAGSTKLIYYRPRFKMSWPNPYLEDVKDEHFELPTLKTIWTGYHEAPITQAVRRTVLGRAKGNCERCGNPAKLYVHHKNRVGKSKRDQADNRLEMLEGLCWNCHSTEHRPENIQLMKKLHQKLELRDKDDGKPDAR